MLQYNLETVNNTFIARFGDRVGWTFLVDNYDFVYSIDENKKTYFYSFEATSPAVGAVVTIANQLFFIHSIAVLLDTSKYIMGILAVTWLGDVMVTALDSQSRGRVFDCESLARDSIYAIARSLPSPVRLSVCLSVCLSVSHTGGSVKDGLS